MNGKERCAIIVTHSSEAASHGDEVLGLMVKCMVLNDKKSLILRILIYAKEL